MDDNNYINNDNWSSYTPYNTGYSASFRNRKWLRTHTASRRTHTISPTDTYKSSRIPAGKWECICIWTVIRPDRQHRRICQ